jgi:tripartite-type tricarboxylate transporter receptor subunit TctC
MKISTFWLGLLGAARFARTIRDRLSGIVLNLLKTTEFTQRAAKDGLRHRGRSPAQFAANMRQEVAALERVINDNGIKE